VRRVRGCVAGQTVKDLILPTTAPCMRRIYSTETPSSLLSAASLFHSLSDPARLALLQHLALGEHSVVGPAGAPPPDPAR
jgi:hypothetical protein